MQGITLSSETDWTLGFFRSSKHCCSNSSFSVIGAEMLSGGVCCERFTDVRLALKSTELAKIKNLRDQVLAVQSLKKFLADDQLLIVGL